MHDPRDTLFKHIANAEVSAVLIAEEAGVIAGIAELESCIKELSLSADITFKEGDRVTANSVVARISGTPKQIALAEERFIGLLAKPSGIATATAQFVENAGPNIQVVSGAWKKLPFSQKEMIRHAVTVGGALPRIADWPFAYIDKNFVRMLGGIIPALQATFELKGYKKIIQIKGSFSAISQEAVDAANHGADIIFVDTGSVDDLQHVNNALREQGLRSAIKLAFAGGVNLENMAQLQEIGVDIIDIGRPIVDAPLLDMRLDVTDTRYED